MALWNGGECPSGTPLLRRSTAVERRQGVRQRRGAQFCLLDFRPLNTAVKGLLVRGPATPNETFKSALNRTHSKTRKSSNFDMIILSSGRLKVTLQLS